MQGGRQGGTFSTKTAERVVESREVGPGRLRSWSGGGERRSPFGAVVSAVARTAAPFHVGHCFVGHLVARAHEAPIPAHGREGSSWSPDSVWAALHLAWPAWSCSRKQGLPLEPCGQPKGSSSPVACVHGWPERLWVAHKQGMKELVLPAASGIERETASEQKGSS